MLKKVLIQIHNKISDLRRLSEYKKSDRIIHSWKESINSEIDKEALFDTIKLNVLKFIDSRKSNIDPKLFTYNVYSKNLFYIPLYM